MSTYIPPTTRIDPTSRASAWSPPLISSPILQICSVISLDHPWKCGFSYIIICKTDHNLSIFLTYKKDELCNYVFNVVTIAIQSLTFGSFGSCTFNPPWNEGKRIKRTFVPSTQLGFEYWSHRVQLLPAIEVYSKAVCDSQLILIHLPR